VKAAFDLSLQRLTPAGPASALLGLNPRFRHFHRSRHRPDGIDTDGVEGALGEGG
jgi:hypothetical protein